jgi:hypothetical protein
MSRKRAKNVVQFEASLAFPTHDEIEQDLQQRLRLWEDPDRKVRYPLPVLDFLINAIACELETGEDDPEFGKTHNFIIQIGTPQESQMESCFTPFTEQFGKCVTMGSLSFLAYRFATRRLSFQCSIWR